MPPHANRKFKATAEAYLSAAFGPHISDLFDVYLHWRSIVNVSNDSIVISAHIDMFPFVWQFHL